VERVSGAPLAKPKGSHDSVQLIIHGPMRLQYWLLSPGKRGKGVYREAHPRQSNNSVTSAGRTRAKYIVPFERVIREQGYACNSLYRQVLLAACSSEWLRQGDVALRGITSNDPCQCGCAEGTPRPSDICLILCALSA
jgi:hypothetical protein